jgi:iron(III) transport system substrate-binding protein
MNNRRLPNNRRAIFLCAVALFCAGTTFLMLSATAFSQTAQQALKPIQSLSPAERKTRLVEGAKREGALVFYGSLAIDASRPLLDAFKKSYPFLKIGHYRSGELGVYSKVSSEAKAGRNEVDVIENSPGASYGLIREGLVDPYHSTEEPAIRREFVDAKGLWHAYSYLVIGLGYNKNFVKDSEAPRTYDDLLNPRWKGKMSFDIEDHDIFGTILSIWGEEKGLAYFRRLAKQEFMLRKGHTLQAQLLAAGESAVGPWLYSPRVLTLIERGAPLALNFLEPVVSNPKALMLARRAPHPNAAALFIDWALSEDGQRFVGLEIARSPVRKGQKQRFEKLAELTTTPMKPEVMGANLDHYTELFRSVFGVK